MVLGRRADHRRAADIDILDDLVAAGAVGDGLGERVEIDDDEVDRADAVFGHRGGVRRVVAHRQQATMDHRVQCLDPPVHHLGKAGEVGDVAHAVAHVAQRLGRAAGRNQFHAMRVERGGEWFEAALVG